MDPPTGETRTSQRRSGVTWLLLSGLLLLRLPFWTGLTIYMRGRPNWVGATFEIGTYVLTLCLLVWQADSLPDFHVDSIALAMILIFKPLETVLLSLRAPELPLAFPRWPSLIIWACAVAGAGLLWARRRALPKLSPRSILWPVLGVGIGILGAVAFGLFLPSRTGAFAAFPSSPVPFLLLQAAFWVPYQIGYAAVTEEPLFRAFLWGQLRRHGWPDFPVLLLQAALFMIGHLYYLRQSPISFWITVPLGALGLGLLAWRTRTISSSMAAHGCVNALSGPAEAVLASLRA